MDGMYQGWQIKHWLVDEIWINFLYGDFQNILLTYLYKNKYLLYISNSSFSG